MIYHKTDPREHRKKRNEMTKSDFKRHVSQKALNIMALSNAGHPMSFEPFRSYVNDTESHIQLRCSAVRAIARYEHLEVIKGMITLF